MSFPIDSLLEQFGVPKFAQEVISIVEPFDWSNTTDTILSLENQLNLMGVPLKVKKDAIKIVTEILDNVCKHAFDGKNQVSSFTSKLYRQKLCIATRNLMESTHVHSFVEQIDALNILDREAIQDRYKLQLKNGRMDEESNAGLGLLEIARRTSNKLQYFFEQYDENSTYFTLFVELDTES